MDVKKRLNTTLPEKTIDKLEKYSTTYGISKSSAIALIVEKFFLEQEMIERARQVPDIMTQLKELADKALMTKPTE